MKKGKKRSRRSLLNAINSLKHKEGRQSQKPRQGDDELTKEQEESMVYAKSAMEFSYYELKPSKFGVGCALIYDGVEDVLRFMSHFQCWQELARGNQETADKWRNTYFNTMQGMGMGTPSNNEFTSLIRSEGYQVMLKDDSVGGEREIFLWDPYSKREIDLKDSDNLPIIMKFTQHKILTWNNVFADASELYNEKMTLLRETKRIEGELANSEEVVGGLETYIEHLEKQRDELQAENDEYERGKREIIKAFKELKQQNEEVRKSHENVRRESERLHQLTCLGAISRLASGVETQTVETQTEAALAKDTAESETQTEGQLLREDMLKEAWKMRDEAIGWQQLARKQCNRSISRGSSLLYTRKR